MWGIKHRRRAKPGGAAPGQEVGQELSLVICLLVKLVVCYQLVSSDYLVSQDC